MDKNKCFMNAVYRNPKESERLALPLRLRSTGHYCVRANWHEKYNIFKDFIQIFWGIEGSGEFTICGEKHILGPGDVTFYLRSEKHTIEAKSEVWRYRWFTFDGPLADSMMNSFNLPRTTFHVGPCPESLFNQLAAVLKDISPSATLRGSALAYEILTLLQDDSATFEESENGLVEQFVETVKENFADPAFSVSAAADIIGAHRSTLFRAVQKKNGISPVNLIMNIRLQHALELLMNSSLTLKEICRETGITNESYLSKLVIAATGMSPGRFRKRGLSSNA